MYPTPVWGRADVPGYGAGPFVRSGYKWTARTTKLHPDGECMHRPPRGETPGGRDQSQRRAPPPPNPAWQHTHQQRGRTKEHTKGATPGAKEHEREGGGGGARGEENYVVQCVVQHKASSEWNGPQSPPVQPSP